MNRPVIAITMGDINGIGPEILAKAFSDGLLWRYCIPVVLGGYEAYEDARRFANGAPRAARIRREDLPALDRDVRNEVLLFEGDLAIPAVHPGTMDIRAGACAIEWVMEAVRWAQAGIVQGIVTCPINKDCIYKAGYDCIGHTDLIAKMTNTPEYRMCLFTDTMRIVHITGHLSLRDAINAVKSERIGDSIHIGYDALKRMGFEHPRIAVAGLNPHAGEAGAFGDEEAREISPAIQRCVTEGIACSGPHPPDTIFGKMREGEYDMVIAMYHDQGHIPLKLVAMDEGVNVTLGIPIVRTSVDHGTAYDIAGKGIARQHSLNAAIRMAAQLCGAGVNSTAARN